MQSVHWEETMNRMQATRQGPGALLVALCGALLSLGPVCADSACVTITAPVLEIAAVDCTKARVWSQLRESGRFPDVFSESGKMTNLCYVQTAPVPAFIGDSQVTIASILSGWTTDFNPILLGGT